MSEPLEIVTREQALYDALRHIAKDFMSTDQLRRAAKKDYGLDYEEALEMAYENMQQVAQEAIQGMKRPPGVRSTRGRR